MFPRILRGVSLVIGEKRAVCLKWERKMSSRSNLEEAYEGNLLAEKTRTRKEAIRLFVLEFTGDFQTDEGAA